MKLPHAIAVLSAFGVLGAAAVVSAEPEPPLPEIPLVVQAGRPLRVAIDRRIRVKGVGQGVFGILVEDVYAYDRVVVPAGTTVFGHVARLQPVSRGARSRAVFSGDLTPLRQTILEFDSLLLDDCREIPIRSEVRSATERLVLQPREAPGKKGVATRARGEVAERVRKAVSAVTPSATARRTRPSMVRIGRSVSLPRDRSGCPCVPARGTARRSARGHSKEGEAVNCTSRSLTMTVTVLAVALAATPRVAAQDTTDPMRSRLPPAVAKAVDEHRPGALIDKLDVEKEGGLVLYDIEFKDGMGEMEVADDGTVLDVVTLIEMKDVPEKAAAAIQQAAQGAAIKEIEKSEVRARIEKEGKKGKLVPVDPPEVVYEAEFKGGEIEVAADGRIIKGPKS